MLRWGVSGVGLAMVSTVACGDEARVDAEFEELCGVEAPVRLLELDPDEALNGVGYVGQYSDRRVLSVRYRDPEDDGLDDFPSTLRKEYWSVDPCGKAPLLIAQDVRLQFLDRWPDLLLACDPETGDVHTLNPTGLRPANLVFRSHDCYLRDPIEAGIVTILPHDEETGALVLQTWPDDPWTQTAQSVVLADPVRLQSIEPHTWPGEVDVLHVSEEEILAITLDDELIQLSPAGGSPTVLATDVRQFEVSRDGRYVIWQEVTTTNEDPDWPEGQIWLADRETGQQTVLAETALSYTLLNAFALAEHDVLHLRLGTLDVGSDVFYALPSLETIEIEGWALFVYPVDEHRFIAGTFFDGPYWLIDLATGKKTDWFDGEGSIRRIDDAGLVMRESRSEGRLWFVPFDGERELLAEHVTFGMQFAHDGRVITQLDVDEDQSGDLIVVDRDTLQEQVVDTRTVGSFSTPDDETDATVVWGVTDGERSGVWMAKVAE